MFSWLDAVDFVDDLWGVIDFLQDAHLTFNSFDLLLLQISLSKLEKSVV